MIPGRLRLAGAAAAFVWVAVWHVVPDPLAAEVGLAVGVLEPLLPRPRNPLPSLLAAFAATSVVTLTLLVANDGLRSPLLPVWVALFAGTALQGPLSAVGASGAALEAVVVALGHGGGQTVVPLAIMIALVGGGTHMITRAQATVVARLEHEVRTDPLTGLMSRTALERELARLDRLPAGRVGLVALDLDGFGDVNKALGHAAGDEVLRVVGDALNARVGRRAFVARMGGDEFMLVVNRSADATRVAEEAVAAISDVALAGARLSATAGLAFVPEDGAASGGARTAADQALRWAKADGKAQVLRFDAERAAATAGVGPDDVAALWRENRIRIVVQPIVDLRRGRIRSYEALARFDVQGDGSPARWLRLAERFGLRRELELACFARALELFPHRPHGTQLGINLSPDVVGHPAVAEALRGLGDLHGLVLELTEEAAVDDYDHLAALLAPHLANGLRIAIDDFGAGQANMRHATTLLPRYLKLDRSLISGVDRDAAKRALVESVVEYAQRVGAYVVAEGVETTTEAAMLRELGVPLAQGYRFARPTAPWPTIDLDAIEAVETAAVAAEDPEILVLPASTSAADLQATFRGQPRAQAAVLHDEGQRVLGLVTRQQLLLALGARFGFALCGDRPALMLADREFVAARPETTRREIATRAMAREEARRYDPVLLLDDDDRLLGKLTIRELLDENLGRERAGVAG